MTSGASEATPEALLAAFTRDLADEFPRVRLVSKRGDKLSAAIDRFLRVASFGLQKSYLTNYTTVLGETIYLPTSWEEISATSRLATLRHERVHLRQRQRMGTVLFVLAYLLPILPIGLAWGRARIEWEAYEETLRATWELSGEAAARSPTLRAGLVSRFTGADYLWMWPFPRTVERWIDEALAKIAAEQRTR